MHPNQVTKRFEPFRRLGHDRIGTTGHGLGLSIADAHGADITVDPGQGGPTVSATFHTS